MVFLEKLEDGLRDRGFLKYSLRQAGFHLFGRSDGEIGYVLLVADAEEQSVTAGICQQLQMAVASKMYEAGCVKVEFLTLILTQHLERVRELTEQLGGYWIIEWSTRKFIVYENQPVDFDGLYRMIEAVLYTRPTPWYKKLAPVTTALVLANVLIFLVMSLVNPQFSLAQMLRFGAMETGKVLYDHEYYRLFTSMFLHFDISHIFNNMLILYLAGEQLEKKLGPIKYLLLYLVSGLGGNLLSYFYDLWKVRLFVVSAGASGAVYGVLGGLLVIVLVNRGRVKEITTRRIVLLLAINLYSGFVGTGVDGMAHLGGVLTGAIIAGVFWLLGKKDNKKVQGRDRRLEL